MRTRLRKTKKFQKLYNTFEKKEIGIHMTTSNLKYGNGKENEKKKKLKKIQKKE